MACACCAILPSWLAGRNRSVPTTRLISACEAGFYVPLGVVDGVFQSCSSKINCQAKPDRIQRGTEVGRARPFLVSSRQTAQSVHAGGRHSSPENPLIEAHCMQRWRSLLMTGMMMVQIASLGLAADSRVGRRVTSFACSDVHGRKQQLGDFADRQWLVVAFVGVECPVVKLYAPRLNEMAARFASQGVGFVAIDANRQDTIAEIAAFARQYSLTFPVLKDLEQTAADTLGAERTPEVFVLDAERVIRYCGRIDDQYAPGVQRRDVREHSLVAALESLLAGRSVAKAETPATGCLIGRAHRPTPQGAVTYSQHVAPILQQHCQECHRPQELAPFSLLTYDDASAWADTIREVVNEDRMPPWFADPAHGEFVNDCRLTEADKTTLFTWIDNGCPAGDAALEPAPRQFASGWRIGQPDAVVYMSDDSFDVPAEGVVDYQHFTAETGFTEDKWIQACEARPGNVSVVHHIVVFIQPPGKESAFLGGQLFGDKLCSVFAPGTPPWVFPEGTAVRIPAGSKLIFQMHYTPNGTAQRDRSFCGFKFADPALVRHKAEAQAAINVGFEIPAGADNHRVTASYKFRRDTLLLNLYPHMHVRGKSFLWEAQYPDGTREVLLNVPRYDFNWQLRYDLVKPKLLPKGTKMRITAHFDNSEENPNNPDPTQAVKFGLQTWEEMMVGFFTAAAAEPISAEAATTESNDDIQAEAGGE